MRKFLLAATAMIAPIALAAEVSAQTAPAVRIAGYMRFHYGYVDQDNSSNDTVKTGKSDFQQEAEVHARVDGRAANGMAYGAVIEIQFDGTRPAGNEPSVTTADLDEAYLFASTDALGRIELGNQDGMGNQMLVGNMILFGAGAFDGDYADFIIGSRPAFAQMDESGDATKINYRTPQFFGFDFGASFGFNQAEGTLECASLGPNCQRTSEFGTIGPGGPQGSDARRNAYELMARYSVALFGIDWEYGAGVIGSDAIGGRGTAPGRDGNLSYVVGAEAAFRGLTVGANYQWGRKNLGGGTLPKDADADDFDQIQAGAIYGVGPWKIGVQWFEAKGEGDTNNPADREDKGVAIGGNYALAPGLELVAEWNSSESKEPGTSRDQSQDIFILGARLSF